MCVYNGSEKANATQWFFFFLLTELSVHNESQNCWIIVETGPAENKDQHNLTGQ